MNYEQDIQILKRHLKHKLWRKEDQYMKFIILMRDLCLENKIEMPNLVVNKNIPSPLYSKIHKTIFLNKYSVISFLHELAHHFFGKDEKMAQDYSEKVFLSAYPSAKKRLKRDKRGFLVKK